MYFFGWSLSICTHTLYACFTSIQTVWSFPRVAYNHCNLHRFKITPSKHHIISACDPPYTKTDPEKENVAYSNNSSLCEIDTQICKPYFHMLFPKYTFHVKLSHANCAKVIYIYITILYPLCPYSSKIHWINISAKYVGYRLKPNTQLANNAKFLSVNAKSLRISIIDKHACEILSLKLIYEASTNALILCQTALDSKWVYLEFETYYMSCVFCLQTIFCSLGDSLWYGEWNLYFQSILNTYR